MNQKMEYKIIDNLPNKSATENLLGDLSIEGWNVKGFTQYQILLERSLKGGDTDENQGLLFD
jgi:hypothetical protein